MDYLGRVSLCGGATTEGELPGDGFEDVGSRFGLEDGIATTGLESNDVEPFLATLVDGDMHFVDPNALVTGAGAAEVALDERTRLGMDLSTIVNITMDEATTGIIVDVLVDEIPYLGDYMLVEEVGKALVVGCHNGKS